MTATLATAVAAAFNFDRLALKAFRHLPLTAERYLAARFMPDKFWLHRVNSPGKQMELADKYAGIEFDIIFYEEQLAFENSHDKESLEKYNLEKNLEVYRRLGRERGIWFDFKNLTQENKQDARKVLSGLLTRYGVKKELVWVESPNYTALAEFRRHGYRTSYYFPYYKLEKMSAREIEAAKKKTLAAAQSGAVDAISFDGGYYDFIDSLPLPAHQTLLCWLHRQSWGEVLLEKKYAKLRNDGRIKVILVKDIGGHHR